MIRFLEDYALGQWFEHGEVAITEAAIAAFCEYDPQPFHRPESAASTPFGRLVASGWQTAGYTMRLLVDSGALGASGAIGLGADDLRWHAPVYPGDRLRVRAVVDAVRAIPRTPSGVVRLRVRTEKHDGAHVLSMTTSAMVPRRPQAPAVSA